MSVASLLSPYYERPFLSFSTFSLPLPWRLSLFFTAFGHGGRSGFVKTRLVIPIALDVSASRSPEFSSFWQKPRPTQEKFYRMVPSRIVCCVEFQLAGTSGKNTSGVVTMPLIQPYFITVILSDRHRSGKLKTRGYLHA